ncbi:DUF3084 domain-containing protein [Cloacibacillus sp. An23]|uniref:DUF3084 domain-containing protein n=1 Tax=Cloacibacillus sp. An23 TaxID=1965591 RepID=UPI000B39C311|nr:DUF3084 domain-containing protein [Cloacibacillus sp. An23]OUO92664.1 hypothetical protein B5F39_10980 [Cloacibacillus sp. An23]
MFEIFREMNWILLGSLIVVSALVSWAGDVIGMRLGKKRITFLKLRPKYTSRIISVLTGVGIAVATLLVLSAASEQVRTALFSMQFVQRQLTDLTAELQKNRDTMGQMEIDLFESRGDLAEKQEELTRIEAQLKEGANSLADARRQLEEMRSTRAKMEKEQDALQRENDRLMKESTELAASVEQMKKESETLKSGIQRLREGRIAALSGEILAQGVLTGPTITPEQVDQYIYRLRGEARALLAYRFGKRPEAVSLPNLTVESQRLVKDRVARNPGRWLLRIVAEGNAVEGEAVASKLECYPSSLIYRENEVLYTHTFAPETPRQDIEEVVFQALKTLNQNAVNDGILRDPISGNVGSIDTAEFLDALDHITEVENNINLEIVAARDIYTEGPLRVRFILK